jgi:DNA polymerase
MNILTLDYETYFDDEYSLKKLTTEAYVRDPRFEALGVGIRWTDHRGARWYAEDGIAQALGEVRWDQTAILCHHAHFDALILSHHYGIKPRFIYDTLSMARLQLGNHVSVSLQSLADHYGLQAKNVPYNLFKGSGVRQSPLVCRSPFEHPLRSGWPLKREQRYCRHR